MIDDVSNDGKTMTDGGNDMVLAGCMVNQLEGVGGVKMAHVIKSHWNPTIEM